MKGLETSFKMNYIHTSQPFDFKKRSIGINRSMYVTDVIFRSEGPKARVWSQ